MPCIRVGNRGCARWRGNSEQAGGDTQDHGRMHPDGSAHDLDAQHDGHCRA